MGRQSWFTAALRRPHKLSKVPVTGNVTLLVFTRNNIDRLEPLIQSTSWIENRIAVDMESQDGTAEKLHNAKFEIRSIKPEVFVDQLRNQYLSIPATPWTLVLDSDEFLSDDAEAQIQELIELAQENVFGFAIPRHNYFCGKKLKGSGFYPDHQIRLFRTDQVIYSAGHHKPPKLKDKSAKIHVLEAPSCLHIHHNHYPTVEEFLRRQLHYAMTDDYNPESNSFDFDDYMLRAIDQFIRRYGDKEDGSISYVAALVMYWDEIVRGLIHWERTGYKGHLSEHIPNQVFFSPEFSYRGTDQASVDAVHQQYLMSRSWRLTAPLRSLNSMRKAILQSRR